MIPTLRPHQQRVLEWNPTHALLVHDMRTGKSLIGQEWSRHPDRKARAVIICLKKNKKEWQDRCPHARVYTKEEFKKWLNEVLSYEPTCVVVDEAHHFAAPLFVAKKRSKQAEALYTLIRKNPEMHVLLLTGTPLTNDPASVHTLLTYIGHYIPWRQFRNEYYELQSMPFLPRPAYFPVTGWRKGANELLRAYADIVPLSACIDYLPEVIEEVIGVTPRKYAYAEDEDLHWTKDHKAEQYEKHKAIKDLGHRKLIIVCHYTEQIDALEKKLQNDRPTYVLDGRTKDQQQVIAAAQQEEDCYLIVQAGMGEGWDGYMFDAMVFASMPHRVLFHTQMRARLVSVDHPKPRVYYYLLASGNSWDHKIYRSVMAGEDFNPFTYEDK